MITNKINFPSQNKLEFIKELREKVDNYFSINHISKYGNMNLMFKTIFVFLLYLTPYLLMITGVIQSFTGVFLCWIIIGVGKAAVGMAVMHDANHRSYSKNQTINLWMSKTLYLLGGFPTTWQYQHNTLHHGYTNIEGHDEDINPGAFLRFSPHKPLYKIHKYQHFYAWFFYGLMTFAWVTGKDFKQLKRYKNNKVPMGNKSYKQLLTTLIVSKILYYGVFMLAPMLILPFAWYWIVVFFMAMHFTSGFILTIIFQTAHVVPTSQYPLPDQTGSMENNWAIHQLLTTSDYSPKNSIFSWFIGGLNYQIEHHLFPNISHVHYRKISKLVKATAHKYGLPYHVQPGFIKAVWEHACMLKKLGSSYSI